MLIGFFKWWCERTMWVEIFIRRANTMFPIYLLTFTGIIAFYVIDFFFRYPSLSLFLVFIIQLSQHFVCVHACILLPLWHHCQNRMIYNYLKSFDFLLLSLCFKHIYSSSSLFEIDYTSLVILDVIFLTFCIRITFTLFIHVLLRPYIGSIMLSHLLLTLCSAIRI